MRNIRITLIAAALIMASGLPFHAEEKGAADTPTNSSMGEFSMDPSFSSEFGRMKEGFSSSLSGDAQGGQLEWFSGEEMSNFGNIADSLGMNDMTLPEQSSKLGGATPGSTFNLQDMEGKSLDEMLEDMDKNSSSALSSMMGEMPQMTSNSQMPSSFGTGSMPDLSASSDMELPDLELPQMEDVTLEDLVKRVEDNSSEVLKNLTGNNGISLDMPVFDLGDTNIDIKNLNMQYANLQLEFAEKGFGEDFELKKAELKGFSSSSVEQFNKAFSDVEFDGKFQSYSLPKNFDMGSWINKVSSQRQSALGYFSGSDAYQTVHNSLSVGDVFAKAAKGVTGLENVKNSSTLLGELKLNGFKGKSISELSSAMPNTRAGYNAQLQQGQGALEAARSTAGSRVQTAGEGFVSDIGSVKESVVGFFTGN